jgi:protocatechuate 3,4-dioxygenase beta subunit
MVQRAVVECIGMWPVTAIDQGFFRQLGVRLTALAVAGILLSSAALPDSTKTRCRDRDPQSWDIRVGPRGEPGEPLVVTGRVLSRQTNAPLAGVTVYTYHADINGQYNAQRNEGGEPRLCGVLRTNDSGQYRIRTPMPGGYAGALPHIHFEVWGTGVARQMLFVNLVTKGPLKFSDTASVSEMMRTWPDATPPRDDPSSMERRVTRGKDGLLHCTKDLVVDTR